MNPHEPTPEFRASLEREIARALRSDVNFPPAPSRTRRLGTIIGIAAGGVITLTVGLVLGASTGYASAETILKARGDTSMPPRPALAVLKNIAFASCPPVFAVQPVEPAQPPQQVQQGIPIVDLPPVTTKGSDLLGGVLGVRQVSSGDVLVNDAARRQVRLIDSALTLKSIVRDSAPGSSTSYGPRPVPLIRYLGDSSLLVDRNAGSMLVMGPSGQVGRAMASSSDDMLLGLNLGFGGVDEKGRILYQSHVREPNGGLIGNRTDSALVVRFDMDTRRADTLARIRVRASTMMVRNGPGTPMRFTMEPLSLIDDWAMLSDGSVAVVRGQDYHIDWISPDGAAHSTQKLPFDWKRISDEEKQKLIDSVRTIEGARLGAVRASRDRSPSPDGARSGARGYSPGASDPSPASPPIPTEYVPPALKDIFDYYPPIREHALTPDLDGNLWILPTSSAQSRNGELVYDVVNAKGDFHRVRVPAGRSIVGFGKGGVVYMIAGDKTNGFHLEKTKLPAKK